MEEFVLDFIRVFRNHLEVFEDFDSYFKILPHGDAVALQFL
jgi:hypothetical protein